jgi:bifunctional non-homologous end joining protein LigD
MSKNRDDPLRDYRRKRDFTRTREPAGGARSRTGARRRRVPSERARPLRFVIQKHRATTLHFDLRLECDGVMKSWAVPKGLSLDPALKRLAMEVEDHPIEYNDFEGAIPEDEYGGGTVMIWDRGTYYADEADENEDDEAAIRRGHRDGKISFFLEGERLRGSFALVRTDAGAKPKWLVIKHRDEHVDRQSDPVDTVDTSVVSGRTLEQIARDERAAAATGESIEPMLAVDGAALPDDDDWAFEEARDGIRVLAYVTPDDYRIVAPGGPARRFDDIGGQLAALARRTGRGFVLDGVVAQLRGKASTFVVSDLLYEDGVVLVDRPWHERRSRLERLFARRRVRGVRLAETLPRGAAAALESARARGWTGLVAKRRASTYQAGPSSDWRIARI